MKLTLSLGGLAAANIALGLLLQWYVFVTLGPGMDTDALFAGMAVPQVVLTIISGSLMHVLVPLLAGQDSEVLQGDAWSFCLLVAIVFVAISVFLYVLAPLWVSLLLPGFCGAGESLTIALTRIQLIGVVFIALSGSLLAVYHARQWFLWAESPHCLVC